MATVRTHSQLFVFSEILGTRDPSLFLPFFCLLYSLFLIVVSSCSHLVYSTFMFTLAFSFLFLFPFSFPFILVCLSFWSVFLSETVCLMVYTSRFCFLCSVSFHPGACSFRCGVKHCLRPRFVSPVVFSRESLFVSLVFVACFPQVDLWMTGTAILPVEGGVRGVHSRHLLTVHTWRPYLSLPLSLSLVGSLFCCLVALLLILFSLWFRVGVNKQHPDDLDSVDCRTGRGAHIRTERQTR